jgi:hypothetical protein
MPSARLVALPWAERRSPIRLISSTASSGKIICSGALATELGTPVRASRGSSSLR